MRLTLSHPRSIWKLHIPAFDFQQWIVSQQSYILYFDGASKGNLKVSSVGGVILDPRGNIETRFTWNLGITNNNQVEEYVLLKGIQLVKKNQIQHIIVIRDSMNTIRSMIKGTLPRDTQLCNITKNIRHMIKDIPQLSFCHVMRENNRLANSQANLATLFSKGTIKINKRLSHHPIL